MGENPDHNSQVSGDSRGRRSDPDRCAGERAGEPGPAIPRPTSPTLLKQAEDEARRAQGRVAARDGRDRQRPQAGARTTSPRRTSTRSSASPRSCCRSRTRSSRRSPRRHASIEALQDGVELTLKNSERGLRQGADRRDRSAAREVRSAPPSGDDDGRHPTSRPTPSSQVFQKGYLLNDRVLRPALVAVAKPKERGGETG